MTVDPDWLIVHPAIPEDLVAAAALRNAVAPLKGRVTGLAGREPFNEIMERVPIAEGVEFESAVVGGVAGLWARQEGAKKHTAILHVHGGWFNWGTAHAFRNFAGQIARSSGTNVFIPDYRLAPEHPFPAAIQDLEACYRGLMDEGITTIALTGDSAGGDLALVLLSSLSAKPAGAVVFSPITDLTLSGDSFETRAEADPFFTKAQAAELIQSYLGEADAEDPQASPLYGDLTGLPPVRIHVGDDEVLLDDSLRYVERAVRAGADAKVNMWMGMPHGFVTSLDGFKAASLALRESGVFLAARLDAKDSMKPAEHEEIARRAYQLWKERGKTHGSDEEDWHRAERELRDQLPATPSTYP